MEPARIVQLSGSGCRISSPLMLDLGTRLEVQVEDDDSGAPPVRLVGKIVHAAGPPEGRYGLRFDGIHPADQERLIRYVYQVQRKELRKTHMQKS
jgi:c-di-GMP-binding flagellar brake protein YcgR